MFECNPLETFVSPFIINKRVKKSHESFELFVFVLHILYGLIEGGNNGILQKRGI